ncbi:MAG: acyloxyacyl hydrolase [Planctomycetota bacterium]|jgi:hypothetical protein
MIGLLGNSLFALTLATASLAPAADDETSLAARAHMDFRLDLAPQPVEAPPTSEGGSPADGPESIPEAVPEFGSRGSRRLYWQAGVGVEIVESENLLALVGVGWERFLADDLSLSVELNGLGFDQKGPDAAAVNVALLLRWYCYEQEDWSLYFDAGAGVMMATNEVPNDDPDNGSNFNFTPQAGMGVSIALDGEKRLMLGARWHHISNANLYEENSGRDSIMGYVGLSLPF